MSDTTPLTGPYSLVLHVTLIQQPPWDLSFKFTRDPMDLNPAEAKLNNV